MLPLFGEKTNGSADETSCEIEVPAVCVCGPRLQMGSHFKKRERERERERETDSFAGDIYSMERERW